MKSLFKTFISMFMIVVSTSAMGMEVNILSERQEFLLKPFWDRYFISGEINTELPNQELANAKFDLIRSRYSDGQIYTMDGISVEYPSWHFNVRLSNTEPLLRLNLEATSKQEMLARSDEVLSLIRE